MKKDIKPFLFFSIIASLLVGHLANRTALIFEGLTGNLVENINAAIDAIIPALQNNPFMIGTSKTALISGAIGAACVWLIFLYNVFGAKNFMRGSEHGSARWGTAKDIKPLTDREPDMNIPLSATEQISVRKVKDFEADRNKNIVVVGGSGSGKTYSEIKPSLMQLHSSYVITDPKGTMKPISKKFIVIVALVGVLVLAAAIVVAVLHKNSNPAISIVGTWYSDKPDSVTFGKEGNYSFAEWNGGNPWLSFAGTYSVSGNTVTLQSAQDGTTTLTINQAQDGSYTLTGKYTYYQTEEAAKAALTAAAAQAAEDEANIIPNTVNKLLGEWTSLDGATTCTFTETGITVHTAATNVLPEETLYHEYEIISDKLIKIVKSGAAANYPYTLTESSDGVMTFYCTGIEYAPTYTKGTLSVQERAERYKAVYGIYPYNYNQSINNNTDNTITDRVISSERNPDVSEYARELDAYVKDMIVGTWKGTFDEWPTADSIYWSYTFSADGTYSFTNGTTTEAGTYTITSDPNNNYYHSSMQLTFDGGERTMQFYFTTTNPVKMITDDQTDPTYLKSLV